MNTLIRGLTPREHFQLHGTLPANAIEQVLDQLDLFSDFLEIATEISPDLINQAYSNPEAFDINLIHAFLNNLREIQK